MDVIEDRARTRKVRRLCAALRAAGATADVLDRIDWRLAEQVAGVRPSSDVTRARVRAALARRP